MVLNMDYTAPELHWCNRCQKTTETVDTIIKKNKKGRIVSMGYCTECSKLKPTSDVPIPITKIEKREQLKW